MKRILESLAKKIGLSSSQLLKCVLLNTAIELFSYIDASTYSSSGFLYHDWRMEDFDHLYSAAPDTGQILANVDLWTPSLPSDQIPDQTDLNQNQSVEVTTCITSVDELETVYLPIPENSCVQAGQVNEKFASNHLGKPESFYYMVGPINLWLEFPLALDMQVTQAPPSADDAHSSEENFLYCFGNPFSFLNVSQVLSDTVVFDNCGAQTTEEPLITNENKTLDISQSDSFFSVLFNLETDSKESIFWDSYDLHLSRSPGEYAYTNKSSKRELKDQDLSKTEYLLTLLEEEIALLSQEDVENLLYADLYPPYSVAGETYPHQNTTKPLEDGAQPVSSTPCVKLKKPCFLQSKGEVHVEKLKHRLFD